MGVIQNLTSIPSYLIFQARGIVFSLLRPILLVSLLCLLSNPIAAIRKLKLFYTSLLYLLFCQDKKWKLPTEDPAAFFTKDMGGTKTNLAHSNNQTDPSSSPSPSSDVTYREKTIIFIRHGESTWNETFNPGDRNKLRFVLFFLPNLLYAIMIETYFLISGKDSDSWFFDSALSEKGVQQSEGLRKFLKREKMKLGSSPGETTVREVKAIQLLLALEAQKDGQHSTSSSSHVVASNLRRAISTAAIALSDRFASSKNSNFKDDPIIVLPCLQEISRNPDALSILPSQGTAHPTWCETSLPGIPSAAFSSLVHTRFHTGNKSLKSNGLVRLEQFCRDIFQAEKFPKSTIIAAGHSLFFRSFFQVFLPRNFDHVSKKKKLVNGGVVMFTLREATISESGKGSTSKKYMIDPGSVVVCYGGFGKHSKG